MSDLTNTWDTDHFDALCRSNSSERLQLIILPTEKCNFRCVYCYGDFALGPMTDTVWSSIVSLLKIRLKELSSLEISWFGGEPLLNYQLVDKASGIIKSLVSDLAPKCSYRASMTTNGSLLTLERLRSLCEFGVRSFQISLDGTEAQHNLTRRALDGGGTFSKIWNHLIAFHKSSVDFKIVLRLHVHQANVDNIDKLCDQLLGVFGGDRRFQVFFKLVGQLGESEIGVKTFRGQNDEESVLAPLKAKLRGSSLEDRSDSWPPFCYASAANSFVIRPNGEIAKCTVAFSSPLNKIGSLKPGGRMDIDHKLFQFWIRGMLEGNPEAAKCPLQTHPAI